LNKYITLIEKMTLLKHIPADEIRVYLKGGGFKTSVYSKNSVVHLEGALCAKLEIILSGKVAVERIDQAGGLMTIAEFYSDDILGGNLLFSKNPHYQMNIMAQQSVVILEIDKELLFQLFCKNADFLRAYLEFISDHAYALGDKIKHYVNRTIRESVTGFLKHECKKQNSNHIKLNTTKTALAEKIGVQRTSLSRELDKMRRDGMILFDSESITVVNTDIIK